MASVDLVVTDGVAVITLNAPEKRNAFAPEMVRDMLAVCDEADADASVGAVVLRASGPSFCAGADRRLLADVGRDASSSSFPSIARVYEAFTRVAALRAPSIAAVRGHAVGAGVNLMLSTDLRLVAESARIRSGFLRIGIHPGGGHFGLLGRVAGRDAVAAMSLFDEEIDGRRAAQLGIAWMALPEEEVEPRAIELARRVAVDPELARAAVLSMRLELGPPAAPPALALEAERAAQMWSLRRRNERE